MKIFLDTTHKDFENLLTQICEWDDGWSLTYKKNDADIHLSIKESDQEHTASRLEVNAANEKDKSSSLEFELPVSPGQFIRELGRISETDQGEQVYTKIVRTSLFELNPKDYSFRDLKNDVSVLLTEKEYILLHALSQAEDNWLSKDDLLKQVWGYKTGTETHTLETHIYRLRQKIEPDKDNPAILINKDQGYQLNNADNIKYS